MEGGEGGGSERPENTQTDRMSKIRVPPPPWNSHKDQQQVRFEKRDSTVVEHVG